MWSFGSLSPAVLFGEVCEGEQVHEPLSLGHEKMNIRNPRSRTVSIRLSEEEYIGLKRLCLVTEARSVSDLARDALRMVLEGPKRDDVMAVCMDEVRNILRGLERKIDELIVHVRPGEK